MSNNEKTQHNIAKCTYCGKIGTVRRERILTMPILLIGLILILFWFLPDNIHLLPKQSLIQWWLFGTPLKHLYLLCEAFVRLLPGVRRYIFERFMHVSGFSNEKTAHIVLASAVGIVYFGIIFAVRCKKNNRDMVCRKCLTHNCFTYHY